MLKKKSSELMVRTIIKLMLLHVFVGLCISCQNLVIRFLMENFYRNYATEK